MRILSILLSWVCAVSLSAQTYSLTENVAYVDSDESDSYRRGRCVADIYRPDSVSGYPTVVWFHGGGLTGGNKFIPEELKNKGIAVVAPNYRLSPEATAPAYIEDAAQAVAWTFANIGALGGDPAKIYVAGHSAGGYLALMLALDSRYLGRYGISPDSVAAWFPLSGQTLTHYTIRAERAYANDAVHVDDMAPLSYLSQGSAPVFLVTGDRSMELPGRYEENVLLQSCLLNSGRRGVHLYELQGFDHGDMYAPGALLIANYIRRQK